MQTRSMRLLLLAGLVAAAACTKSRGTRTPEGDANCGDTHPHAYDFADQKTAAAEGCRVKRIYRGVTDPRTGQLHDDESWVFCCPKR